MESQDEQGVEQKLEPVAEVSNLEAEAEPSIEAADASAAQTVEDATASEPTITTEPSKQSRGKIVTQSLLGSLGVLVVFFAGDLLGMLISIVFLFVVKGYSTLSIETLNAIIAQNEGFVSLVCQAVEFVGLGIYWLVIRRRSIMRAKARYVSYEDGAAAVALRILIIVLMGIALQFCISGVLSSVVYLFPSIAEAYESLANNINNALGDLLGQISATFGGPLVEELLVRGLFFEFMLRIFQGDFGEWRLRSYPQKRSKPQLAPTASTAVFWIANIVQALLFGIIHLNLIQGSYAFVTGLLLGWVYWRTGKLRYSMLLHLAFNGSSLFVDALLNGLGLTTEIAVMVVGVVFTGLTIAAIVFFAKKTKPQQQAI